jgi:hypothetical protein
MKVLDLFCGLKGWTAAFVDDDVCSVDYDSKFNPDLCIDILNLNVKDLPFKPDIVLASPPCESFSVASIGVHWNHDKSPKTEQAAKAMKLVEKTVSLIGELKPTVAIIENPRGMLRKLNLIPVTPQTVWYCHFGEQRAKPTDLWGLPFPQGWQKQSECHYRRANHQNDCCCHNHVAAARGSQTGTQGMGSYEIKSKIPFELSTAVRTACATRR